jgi:predicted glycoside hydrolase/deacetylase ChbG (UPF0249 family)
MSVLETLIRAHLLDNGLLPRILIITADDYGYSPAYDRGILEAAQGGSVDAVSVMVNPKDLDPEPLLNTGAEIGLHYVLPFGMGRAGEGTAPRAGDEERRAAVAELHRQLERFQELFGRPPAYLDGHHHAHAFPGLAAAIARAADEHDLPARSIDDRHRRLLRCLGVPTPDRLIGRLSESEPPRPPELDGLQDGVTEWMVHPGHRDPAAGSAYDAGREEDLRLLLELGDREAWRSRGVERRSHADALAG